MASNLNMMMHDPLAGRDRQVGLPFGNSSGPVPLWSPNGADLGQGTGSFTSRDDSDGGYMGFPSQGTVAKSIHCVFDQSIDAKYGNGTRPEHFGRHQLVFVHREVELGERREISLQRPETLSTLNKLLFNARAQFVRDQRGVLVPPERIPGKFHSGRDVLDRFNMLGVLDVVKPTGSNNNGAPSRADAYYCIMNIVFGYNAHKCINYWINRPSEWLSISEKSQMDYKMADPSEAANQGIVSRTVFPANREGMFLHLVLRPFLLESMNKLEYYFQFVPVATLDRGTPTFESVWGEPKGELVDLVDGCPTVYCGKTTFIDDRSEPAGCNMAQFTHPLEAQVPLDMMAQLPTLTVIVSHSS